MANNSMLMPLQIERQYSGSLDADYSFDTLEELKTYATTSALSYSGQILYCKGTDTLYKVNKDKTDTTTLGGGADGKSAYEIWLEKGNTGTEEDFLESLKGEGTDSSFVVTGAIDTDNPDAPVTLDQTFEEIKTAYDNDKTIVADILVAGEAQYIFNLLYVLEDAIAFEWINSAAKTGGQINLMSDNTVSFTMTSFESGGESYDDTEIRELVNGKQDATIFIDATMSTVKDSWDNYLLNVDEEYRYSKVQDMLVDGKTVILRVKVDGVLVELPCVSYESYTDATLTFAAPYYNSSTEEKGSYIAFCASTVGWKLGIKVVKEASSTDMSPFIIKSAYTEGSNGFTIDTSTTTPALWNDWYPAFEAGRPVYWDLHRNSIDSNVDVIRLYPHSHGIYYESTGTKECQFTSIGGYPDYDSKNDSTKYFYIGWFRSGSAPASNYKFVKQYKIGEIPTGGTTGQILVKKSDTDRDVKWADPTTGGLVITGNYTVDDEDNWVVSNIDKTFAEINEAISNNQDVVLKIYPEGDTTNPYILYPAMHYANMGTAFSLMVSDTGQISGLSVMITADNQVIASRNEYDFSESDTDQLKEAKALNNQFGDITKLYRITDAPTESGRGYTVKLVAQRKNATAHTEYLSVSRVNDTYTFESNIELQEKNGSTGEPTTMENSNFLIVDANYEVWAHIPSYTYAYVELISPNVKGTFVIDGSEGEFAEDAVLDTFSKRETDTLVKKGEVEALKKSVSDGKTAVAGAITAKGIDTAADAEFATIEANILKIDTENPNLVMKQSNITDKTLGSTIACGNGVFVAYDLNKKILYYSEDGGATWNISSLDVSSSSNGSIIYATKHHIFIGNFGAMGIYTSYDGNNWTSRLSTTNANTFLYDDVTGICISGNSNGGGAGLWYSSNGYTWSVNSTYSSSKITSMKAAGGRLYVGIGGSTYTSIDGYNWTAVSALSSKLISSLRYDAGLWMANISGATTGQGWYYSNDGVTFAQSSVTFSGTTYGTDFQDMKRINNTTWIVSMYTGIWYTTDKGKTWASSNLDIKTGNWKLFSHLDKFYAASQGGPGNTYGGIYYSTDGKTWTVTTGAINASGVTGTSNGIIYFLRDKCVTSTNSTSAIGVYVLGTDGKSWTKTLSNDYIIYGDNSILITRKGKYSFDGVNWKDPDVSGLNASTDYTITKVFYDGGSFVMSPNSGSQGMAYANLLK